MALSGSEAGLLDQLEHFWSPDGPARSPTSGSPADGPVDAPVAFGGRLTPAVVLTAHRSGLFPMPQNGAAGEGADADGLAAVGLRVLGADPDPGRLAWWSPDPRPVLAFDTVRLGQGLTKTLCSRRRWTTTVNRDFAEVVSRCRAGREPRWLTDELVDTMTALHRGGWYHSVEVWAGTDLVGGAIGLGCGPVLSADTMFHRTSGASQIALVDLAARLADVGVPTLDLQWDSPHARRLGATPVSRSAYLDLVAGPAIRVDLPDEVRVVDDLLGRLRRRGGS
jgi:leucyl/phenylalanyl-tRNA---protein transferase